MNADQQLELLKADVGLIIGAPDEPIRRQRQIAGYLDNIDGLIANQTEELEGHVQNVMGVLTILKSVQMAGWILVAVLARHVIHHW